MKSMHNTNQKRSVNARLSWVYKALNQSSPQDLNITSENPCDDKTRFGAPKYHFVLECLRNLAQLWTDVSPVELDIHPELSLWSKIDPMYSTAISLKVAVIAMCIELPISRSDNWCESAANKHQFPSPAIVKKLHMPYPWALLFVYTSHLPTRKNCDKKHPK